jgi:S-adenosylmethionine:tRNA ribosyltransferase-isomerase
MLVSDFFYSLPEELIAKEPASERDGSRLLSVPLDGTAFADRRFRDLPRMLQAGDLLVINDARVLNARLRGHKAQTFGQVELLLDRPLEGPADRPLWRCLGESSKGFRTGQQLLFPGGATAEVIAVEGEGFLRVRFSGVADLTAYCATHGELPLPTYLGRPPDGADQTRYQTIFAREDKLGAVAAPTAGLHFSPSVVEELAGRGVAVASLTLFVGPGTFLPVRTERIEDHRMEAERFDIPSALAEAVASTRLHGGRVIAVGTTAARALESASDGAGGITVGSGLTDLFIRPGHRFRSFDGLLTNFHLPGSTLLMLVSALAGRERVMGAYAHAVAQRYRFFSYGDCCLFL